MHHRLRNIALGARPTAAGLAFTALAFAASTTSSAPPAPSPDIERGRYLVVIGGCNDCHTPGYGPSGGQVEERLWLTGDALGFQGPWGTSYPANLRLNAAALSEEAWIARARQPLRPPMPWFNLRDMTDADVRAIYRYLRHAGPAGAPAPAFVPPGGTPTGPVIRWPEPPR